MEWENEEHLIRYARLRDELKPIPIYLDEAMRPDWVAISHVRIWSARRPAGIESFELYFLMDDGSQLDWYGFDTLQIAVDQAKAIAGVQEHEWKACHLKSPRKDGSFAWEDVMRLSPTSSDREHPKNGRVS
jgi:hypothetical protein